MLLFLLSVVRCCHRRRCWHDATIDSVVSTVVDGGVHAVAVDGDIIVVCVLCSWYGVVGVVVIDILLSSAVFVSSTFP